METQHGTDGVINNPGSLKNFLESGGTQEEWQQRASEFFHYKKGLGLSDSELLNGEVKVEYIQPSEESISA